MNFNYWQSRQDQQWYWNLTAGNGEIIAHGEGYRREADYLHAIGLVMQTNAYTPIRKIA